MRRYLKLMFSAGALLFAALLALSACTVVVEEPRPSPGPSFCTMEHQPVCARRFDQRRTFSNACLARQSGFDVIHSGECRSSSSNRPIACTREYAPVCAASNGRLRTFSNSCEARSAGWRIIRNGRC